MHPGRDIFKQIFCKDFDTVCHQANMAEAGLPWQSTPCTCNGKLFLLVKIHFSLRERERDASFAYVKGVLHLPNYFI